MVSGEHDGTLRLFDLHTKQQLHVFNKAHSGSFVHRIEDSLSIIDKIQAVAVSSSASLIVSGSNDKAVRMFDIITKQLVSEYENAHSGRTSNFIPTE